MTDQYIVLGPLGESGGGSGFTPGGDLSGSSTSQTVIGIQGNPVSSSAPSSNQALVWNGSAWAPANQAGGSTPTGTGIPHIVSGVQNVAASLIVDADVSSSAAIEYSKLNLTGDIVNADISSSAGIVYSKLSLGGNVVNADISSSAAIAVSKLAAGTSGQILVNNSTPAPAWVSASGDATISSSGAVSVVSIHGSTVPAGGSLTVGNTLGVSGSGALSYSALNLAGGSAYVTGVLPAANMAAVNLAGGSSSVTGQLPVANLANGTAAQVLVTNSGATAPAWVSISGDSTIAASGAVTNTGIQGKAITITSLATGNILAYNGTAWVNTPQALLAATSSDFIALGGTQGSTGTAASGIMRLVNAPGTIISQRNAGGTADLALFASSSAGTFTLGATNTYSLTAANHTFGGVPVMLANVSLPSSSTGARLASVSGALMCVGTGGAITTLAPIGSGTANTQNLTRPSELGVGRITSSGGTVVLDVPLSTSGTSGVFTFTGVIRVVTASVASVGDTYAVSVRATFKNVGGTVSQVGSSTTVMTACSDSSLNSGSGLALSISGTNIVATLTATVSSGTLSAADCTIDVVEAIIN